MAEKIDSIQLQSQEIALQKSGPHLAAVAVLRSIEAIHIQESVKKDGHRYYILNITSRDNQLPTTVYHRYSEFMQLREYLYTCAFTGHPRSAPCKLCSKIMQYKLIGRAKPNIVAKVIHSKSAICSMLQQYMTDLVTFTRQAASEGDAICIGQQHIPLVVQAFVSGEAIPYGTHTQ